MKYILIFIVIGLFLGCKHDKKQVKYPLKSLSSVEFNKEITNKTSNEYMPLIGVWGWSERELQPDGYKKVINQISKNSPYNLIVLFLRFPKREIIEEEVHAQVKRATKYALKHNIALVADLDIRLARQRFKELYPKDLQEMVRIKEVPISDKDSIKVVMYSVDLSDHYTGGKIRNYVPLSSKLLRVFSYNKTSRGIESKTILNITDESKTVMADKDSIIIAFPKTSNANNYASIMVSFTHLYPDVFSPNLEKFQQKILLQYSDIPLAGIAKDEWGFPPYQDYIFNSYPDSYHTGITDFWYSKSMAEEYNERTKGRSLLLDFLLMTNNVIGKESERMMAINMFNKMIFDRNSELEHEFYQKVKEIYGPSSVVAVHPTWWPYPESFEFKKNGLDWWNATRDWAQTDEVVPFGVRTALSKKWKSPVWYNMYYQKGDIGEQLWSSVLGGGRINYLPYDLLFDSKLMRAQSRIRLLNFITESPLNSSVAVVFGHYSAMNWAGPNYEDVGMGLIDSLWHNGYPADLIPTSEIRNGSLYIDNEGNVCYGKQKYTAVVLYKPEFETETTLRFFNKAAKTGKTKLFYLGNWDYGFNGKRFNGDSLLSSTIVRVQDVKQILPRLYEVLNKANIFRSSPATTIITDKFNYLANFEHKTYAPPTTGFSKLIDGTIIYAAGTNDISGDPIKLDYEIDKQAVKIDAIGIVAFRFNSSNKIVALAAGGLKHFEANGFKLELNERKDIALWKDDQGRWEGVIQGRGKKLKIPEELLEITNDWTLLSLPTPPSLN